MFLNIEVFLSCALNFDIDSSALGTELMNTFTKIKTFKIK
jgi:hypothetical protein